MDPVGNGTQQAVSGHRPVSAGQADGHTPTGPQSGFEICLRHRHRRLELGTRQASITTGLDLRPQQLEQPRPHERYGLEADRNPLRERIRRKRRDTDSRS
jgi:hypothetical protein